jgi:hypothetical protein
MHTVQLYYLFSKENIKVFKKREFELKNNLYIFSYFSIV